MTKHLQTWALVVVLGMSGGSFAAAQGESSQEKAAKIAAEAARRQQEEAAGIARRQQQDARRAQEQDVAKLKALYPLTPLTVQVVVSKYQGEKKVSSLPYTLSINANSIRWGGRPSQLRMGGQIPIPLGAPPTIDGKPIPGNPTAGGPVQYKEIGTNIDATANSAEGGRFQLNISIEDTSVYADDPSIEGGARVRGMPVFRSFRSNNELILRDGQSTQFTAATDRVSGEVIKVDVTLTVVK